LIERFDVGASASRIVGIFTAPDRSGRFPCVMLSHGLISSKESEKYIALSEALQAIGIASCRFDYHGCGESDGNIEETTLTIRLGNLDAVTEWALVHPRVDAGKIGLLGSSFGACTSLVKAARDRRITCLSLWATPHTIRKDEERVRDDEPRFHDTFYEDFAGYDLPAEARKTSFALVIHGEADEVVPAHEGEDIYENIRQPKEFVLIEGADHTFSKPEHREWAINLAQEWFRRHLLP
jgi:uncharacterized protein